MKTLNKFVKNKKGQIGKKIEVVVIIILTIVVLFEIFTGLIPEVQSAGDELGDANRCSDAGGSFNVTQALCLNGTSPADTAQVSFDAIPISSIFSGTGIIVLLLMVGLLIGILRVVLPKRK